jgi:crotonobetainyl-CoA:carnitine CoA-transferase CaiB-like acyl-CoA transferase
VNAPGFDLLQGLKVIDLSRLLPGPYATMVLADYGADVIKIEAPEGGDYLRSWEPLVDGTSAFFLAVNRNKRSLTLNLKTDSGRRLLHRLAAEADVLFESFRPGVMDSLGCDYQTLAGINPALVYCSLTGYGQSGPKARKAGHDLNYQAEAGILGTTAAREIPSLSGVQVADVAGGALQAVGAVLAASIRALKSGRGAFLDISMTDGLVNLLPLLSAYHYADGRSLGPDQTFFNGQLACYSIYRTADGREMALGALERKFWENFCRAAGCEELLEGDHQDLDRQPEFKARLRELFATRTAAAWQELLEGRDTCCELVKNFAEVCADPHFRERGLFWELTTTGGRRLLQTNTAAQVDGCRPPAHRPAPGLGEHTEEILAGIGLTAEEISAFRSEGAI